MTTKRGLFMKKKSFRNILLTTLPALFLLLALLMTVIYVSLSQYARTRLAIECGKLATLTNEQGTSALICYGGAYAGRITLIAADGSVLYDNQVDFASMENHADRKEVQTALLNGVGQSTRHSSVDDETYYYYAHRLTNGSVIRVATTTKNIFHIFYMISSWMILIIPLMSLLVFIAAEILSGRMALPLQTFSAAEPSLQKTYPELAPLFDSLTEKNNIIQQERRQINYQKTLLQEISNHMTEGMALLNRAGEMHYTNRVLNALLFMDTGESLRFSDEPEYIKAVRIALEGRHGEGKVTYKGRSYQIHTYPLPQDIGKSSDYVAMLFVTDITDKEFAKMQRYVFTSGISHHLIGRLTRVVNSMMEIENDISASENCIQLANAVRVDMSHLVMLIEEALGIPYVMEDTNSFESVDLFQLAKEVCARYESKAEAHQVAMSASGSPVTVHGQPQILEHMISNLVENAIVYNKADGRVIVTCGKEDDIPYLQVTDTGIGISLVDQIHVFERFYRVKRPKGGYIHGNGLGLSVVRHAAVLHHAEIGLVSVLGGGTSFTLRFLPRKEES